VEVEILGITNPGIATGRMSIIGIIEIIEGQEKMGGTVDTEKRGGTVDTEMKEGIDAIEMKEGIEAIEMKEGIEAVIETVAIHNMIIEEDSGLFGLKMILCLLFIMYN